MKLRERASCLRRHAFCTVTEELVGKSAYFHRTCSKARAIDVVITVDEVDVEKQRQMMDCSVTRNDNPPTETGSREWEILLGFRAPHLLLVFEALVLLQQ
jgi:hypothetical protein